MKKSLLRINFRNESYGATHNRRGKKRLPSAEAEATEVVRFSMEDTKREIQGRVAFVSPYILNRETNVQERQFIAADPYTQIKKRQSQCLSYPSPIMSLVLGEIPRKPSHAGMTPNRRPAAALTPLILATSTVGVAEIPPNRKLPATLIPAVCHLLNRPNRTGSVAMASAAIFPT